MTDLSDDGLDDLLATLMSTLNEGLASNKPLPTLDIEVALKNVVDRAHNGCGPLDINAVARVENAERAARLVIAAERNDVDRRVELEMAAVFAFARDVTRPREDSLARIRLFFEAKTTAWRTLLSVTHATLAAWLELQIHMESDRRLGIASTELKAREELEVAKATLNHPSQSFEIYLASTHLMTSLSAEKDAMFQEHDAVMHLWSREFANRTRIMISERSHSACHQCQAAAVREHAALQREWAFGLLATRRLRLQIGEATQRGVISRDGLDGCANILEMASSDHLLRIAMWVNERRLWCQWWGDAALLLQQRLTGTAARHRFAQEWRRAMHAVEVHHRSQIQLELDRRHLVASLFELSALETLEQSKRHFTVRHAARESRMLHAMWTQFYQWCTETERAGEHLTSEKEGVLHWGLGSSLGAWFDTMKRSLLSAEAARRSGVVAEETSAWIGIRDRVFAVLHCEVAASEEKEELFESERAAYDVLFEMHLKTRAPLRRESLAVMIDEVIAHAMESPQRSEVVVSAEVVPPPNPVTFDAIFVVPPLDTTDSTLLAASADNHAVIRLLVESPTVRMTASERNAMDLPHSHVVTAAGGKASPPNLSLHAATPTATPNLTQANQGLATLPWDVSVGSGSSECDERDSSENPSSQQRRDASNRQSVNLGSREPLDDTIAQFQSRLTRKIAHVVADLNALGKVRQQKALAAAAAAAAAAAPPQPSAPLVELTPRDRVAQLMRDRAAQIQKMKQLSAGGGGQVNQAAHHPQFGAPVAGPLFSEASLRRDDNNPPKKGLGELIDATQKRRGLAAAAKAKAEKDQKPKVHRRRSITHASLSFSEAASRRKRPLNGSGQSLTALDEIGHDGDEEDDDDALQGSASHSDKSLSGMTHKSSPKWSLRALWRQLNDPNSRGASERHPWFVALDVSYIAISMMSCIVATFQVHPRGDELNDSVTNVTFLAAWNAVLAFYSFIWIASRFFLSKRKGDWDIIDDYPAIRRHYLRTWFWYDCLYSLPFDFLFAGWYWDLYQWMSIRHCLRLPRIVVLGQSANPLLGTRLWYVFLSFCMWMLLAMHLIAIVFWQLEPEYDYVESLYWSIATTVTIGYGDIYVTTQEARIFATVALLIGAVTLASMNAFATVFLRKKDRLEQEHDLKCEMVNAMLHTYGVPWEVQLEVMAAVPSFLERDHEISFQRMMVHMPASVSGKVEDYVRVKLLKDIPLFKCVEEMEALLALSAMLEQQFFPAGEPIIEQGDDDRQMFFLVRGVAEVVLLLDPYDLDGDGDLEACVTSVLHPGSYFGESSLFASGERKASVQAVTVVEVLSLSFENFEMFRDLFPNTYGLLHETLMQTATAHNKHMDELMAKKDKENVERGLIKPGERPGSRMGSFANPKKALASGVVKASNPLEPSQSDHRKLSRGRP